MRKFFVKLKNNKAIFNESDLKHLKVLRIKENSEIKCIDQFNNNVLVRIMSLNPFSAKVVNIEKTNNIVEPYPITCFMGIIKKQNFELAVQKLNELNIKKIVPIYFNYSQGNYELNKSRLEKIIFESKKQCNRSIDLIIEDPITFDDLVSQLNNYKYNFLAYEKNTDKKLDYNSLDILKNDNISFLIGPEGGFSEKEILFLKSHCIGLKLTNTILKSETASIYLASVLIERFFYEK